MASAYPAYARPHAYIRMPDRPSYPPSEHGGGSTSPESRNDTRVDIPLARTPSPTPSEARELQVGVFDWKTISKWRFWIRREWLWHYVALVIIMVVFALITIYHDQIVDWLKPLAEYLRDEITVGWLIPIGILFILSFPPLFGHEIVAVLCGLVWGLWVGFGIVAAGTFLGEVGNYYAFKYCCRARGEKIERNNISYACLAKVVRDGGFKIALIARLSAIPGHFTTAVFSTCGMGILVFSLAAILSMPKQMITVYLGVILKQESEGTQTKESKIISDVVLGVSLALTFLAMWYIYHRMGKVKPEIIYARRKARQEKMLRAASDDRPYSVTPPNNSSGSTISLDDPSGIPLTRPLAQGYAANSTPSIPIAAPQPYHQYGNVNGSAISRERIPTYRQDSSGGAAYDSYGYRRTGPRESMDNVAWDMGVRRQDAFDPRTRNDTSANASMYTSSNADLHHRHPTSSARGTPEMAQTPTQPLSSPYQAGGASLYSAPSRRTGSPDQLTSPYEDPAARQRSRSRQRTLESNSEAPDSPFADPTPYRGNELAHAQEEAYGGSGESYTGPYPAFHGHNGPSRAAREAARSPPPPTYSYAAGR
ncbi:uncharacterized protein SCHCODRAFT_02610563 [Schizophyllum commune H4-8]|uniref:Golgi apparatus membrane protein TVP38 n=1 Tax=Schizophyllum commune (strain H4-8 / FGSC 9210) TaxID=578458 RepID=D8PRV5_SCHCM|nr:uncharacterized protein SCHCODRAFT_02610563 [Schizophyllum commune H4-8]KAI5897902.1 hypothetical protein SCHCODRAFT_02610563 [Schizophyllum commune H4-8]